MYKVEESVIRAQIEELLEGCCMSLHIRLQEDTIVYALRGITHESFVEADTFLPPEAEQGVRSGLVIELLLLSLLGGHLFFIKAQVRQGDLLNQMLPLL